MKMQWNIKRGVLDSTMNERRKKKSYYIAQYSTNKQKICLKCITFKGFIYRTILLLLPFITVVSSMCIRT